MVSAEGGVDIEEIAREDPGRHPPRADRSHARAQGLSGSLADGTPAERGPVRNGGAAAEAVRGPARERRHAGRGEPAGPPDRRDRHAARREGHHRRQRALPPAGARRAPLGVPRRPDPGPGEREGPAVRQARRRGRDHRQRRRPGHVHARRGHARRAGRRRTSWTSGGRERRAAWPPPSRSCCRTRPCGRCW